MVAFLFVILISNTFYGASMTQWSCGMNQCKCSSALNETDTTPVSSNNKNKNNSDTMAVPQDTVVVCYLKTLPRFKSVSLSLPVSIKALTILCVMENAIQHLPQAMFARHPHMKQLTLKSCGIARIHPKFGLGSDSLQKLNFQETLLPVFAPDTFSSVKSLTSLVVVQSSMQNFPFLQSFKNLQILDISDNYVKSPYIKTHDGIESKLFKLVHVNLSYNGIKDFPVAFFSIVPNVKNLFLDGNKITRLSVPSNITLKHIEKFTAVGNYLQFIEFDAFTSSRNLTQFRITGSGTSSLTFKKKLFLPHLVDFKLSKFKINDSIWDLIDAPSLLKLDLSSNGLESIKLKYLPQLQKIYLQDNSISYLYPETFHHQPNMLVVNISSNLISHLPENIFQRNQQLIALLMKDNNVSSLGSQLFHTTPNVFYLDLSYNVLTRIPFGFFYKIPNLLYLHIAGNRLKFLPDFSSLGNLFYLDISDNQLLFLTGNSFRGLRSMETLIASNNKLRGIPKGIFTPCPQLLEATFDNNRIEFIESLERHPRIIKLSFQNNYLKDFYSVSPFAHLKSLAYIFLDDNNFTSIIPHMFPASIEAISMSNNTIYKLLGNSLDNMPRLSLVNFMLNRYVIHIPQTSVQKYSYGKNKPSILLGFVELGCNCRLGYLKVWDEKRHGIRVLQNRFPHFRGLDRAYCTSPLYPEKTIKFKDLPLRDFVCEYNESLCFDGVCNCCHSPDLGNCSCVYTCPLECKCFQGGSGFWRNYVHIDCKDRNLTHVPATIPALANFVYMDGNALGVLTKASLSHLSHVEELYLNQSGIVSIEDRIFEDMSKLDILYLDHNLLTYIGRFTFCKISSLRYLDLSHNNISLIESGSFSGLIDLKVLHLNNNQLKVLGDNVLEPLSLHTLTLAFNPWSCDCDVIGGLSMYLSRKRSTIIVKDMESICCVFASKPSQGIFLLAFQENSTPFTKGIIRHQTTTPTRNSLGDKNSTINKMNDNGKNYKSFLLRNNTVSVIFHNSSVVHFTHNDAMVNVSCFHIVKYDFQSSCESIIATNRMSTTSNHGNDLNPAIIIALIVTGIIFVVLVSFIVLITMKRSELQALLYAKTGLRIWDKKAEIDSKEKGTKPFDAFISYSQGDQEYVCNTLVPELENKKYTVCVHYRDFPVGDNISDVIGRAIRLSSRTILIATKHFLKSNWCRYEFQTAHHQVLKEGSHRLILILLEDIPEEEMEPDFRINLKLNTCLKAQDPWFWEKLQFALPEISNRADVTGCGDRNLRGMIILSKDNETVYDSAEEGCNYASTEAIVQADGEKQVDFTPMGKIDWVKERERIMNERQNEEQLRICETEDRRGLEECKIVTDWRHNIDIMYVNKCYESEGKTDDTKSQHCIGDAA